MYVDIEQLNSSINNLSNIVEQASNNDRLFDAVDKMNAIITSIDTYKYTESINFNFGVVSLVVTSFLVLFTVIGYIIYNSGKTTAKEEAQKGLKEFLKEYQESLNIMKNDIGDLRIMIEDTINANINKKKTVNKKKYNEGDK